MIYVNSANSAAILKIEINPAREIKKTGTSVSTKSAWSAAWLAADHADFVLTSGS